MTIDQLKRHMDRRFDRTDRRLARLDRTKADKIALTHVAKRAEVLAVDTRRYFQIIAESLSDDIRRVADVIDEVKHLSSVMSEHESRISDLERGAR